MTVLPDSLPTNWCAVLSDPVVVIDCDGDWFNSLDQDDQIPFTD